MREVIRDAGRLEHILKSIDVLLTSKEKYKYDEVVNNPIVFFGFVKHLEIIGEAVYKLTKEFRQNHNEVDWNTIESMRHILVHGYYKIDPKMVWDTIENDLSGLRPVIEKLYNEELSKRNS